VTAIAERTSGEAVLNWYREHARKDIGEIRGAA
jgi:hypothetical protein